MYKDSILANKFTKPILQFSDLLFLFIEIEQHLLERV